MSDMSFFAGFSLVRNQNALIPAQGFSIFFHDSV